MKKLLLIAALLGTSSFSELCAFRTNPMVQACVGKRENQACVFKGYSRALEKQVPVAGVCQKEHDAGRALVCKINR